MTDSLYLAIPSPAPKLIFMLNCVGSRNVPKYGKCPSDGSSNHQQHHSGHNGVFFLIRISFRRVRRTLVAFVHGALLSAASSNGGPHFCRTRSATMLCKNPLYSSSSGAAFCSPA